MDQQQLIDKDYKQIEDDMTKVRFEFALNCLNTVTLLKKNKNIAFSPHAIYEGLLSVYLASSGDTEKQLRRKLGLPDSDYIQNTITNWKLYATGTTNKDKDEFSNFIKKNSCWITNTKFVKKLTQHLFIKNKELEIIGFHQATINLQNCINAFLRTWIKPYMSTPMELNKISKNMEIILLTILGLKDKIKQNDPTDKDKIKQNDLTDKDAHSWKKARTAIFPNLQMIVTELPLQDDNNFLSLFLLHPATRFTNYTTWQLGGNISELIERLATREGTEELRKVLDDIEPSTERWRTDKVLWSGKFRLKGKLDIDELLDELGIQELLEHDKAILSNFTKPNLHVGGAIHQTYIKVSRNTVIAGAVNMFFTKHKGSFNKIIDIDDIKCPRKFVWLLYCKKSHSILFIGTINDDKRLSTHEECEFLLFEESPVFSKETNSSD